MEVWKKLCVPERKKPTLRHREQQNGNWKLPDTRRASTTEVALFLLSSYLVFLRDFSSSFGHKWQCRHSFPQRFCVIDFWRLELIVSIHMTPKWIICLLTNPLSSSLMNDIESRHWKHRSMPPFRKKVSYSLTHVGWTGRHFLWSHSAKRDICRGTVLTRTGLPVPSTWFTSDSCGSISSFCWGKSMGKVVMPIRRNHIWSNSHLARPTHTQTYLKTSSSKVIHHSI